MQMDNKSAVGASVLVDERKREGRLVYQKPDISLLCLSSVIAGAGGSILDADQFSSQPEMVDGRPQRKRG